MKPRRASRPSIPFTLSVLLVPAFAVRAEDRAPAAAAAPPAAAPAPAVTPPAGTAEKSAAAKAAPAEKKSAAAVAAKPVAPPPLSPRFQQVRDRIKALYGSRDQPAPAYDPRLNPFRTQPVAPEPAAATPTPAKPGEPAAATPPPPPVALPAVTLKQAAALLKVTGFVEREGRILLNINQALYKEGDVIKVTVQGQAVLLRATKVSRTSLTVELNGAETTLKF